MLAKQARLDMGSDKGLNPTCLAAQHGAVCYVNPEQPPQDGQLSACLHRGVSGLIEVGNLPGEVLPSDQLRPPSSHLSPCGLHRRCPDMRHGDLALNDCRVLPELLRRVAAAQGSEH